MGRADSYDAAAAGPTSDPVVGDPWLPDHILALAEALDVDAEGSRRGVALIPGDPSQAFASAFALASLTGWETSDFDARLARALGGDPMVGDRDRTSDVSEAWEELGAELGFQSLVDDLALVVASPGTGGVDEGHLVARVRSVVDSLVDAGHPHAAVAVIASDVSRDLGRRVFEAGAQVIHVPRSFFDMPEQRRRSFVRSLFSPPGPDVEPAGPGTRRQDAEPGLYVSRNPDLTETDVEHWWKRLTDATPEG